MKATIRYQPIYLSLSEILIVKHTFQKIRLIDTKEKTFTASI